MFSGLTELNLANNLLSELPDSIGNLVKLRVLDVRFIYFEHLRCINNKYSFNSYPLRPPKNTKKNRKNYLNYLPFVLGDLTELKKLEISDNPLEGMPTHFRRNKKNSTKVTFVSLSLVFL